MTNPIRTNVEEMVRGVDLTRNEWNMIKVIRQIRYGNILVVKNGGIIIRAEATLSFKVTENMDTNLKFGVE